MFHNRVENLILGPSRKDAELFPGFHSRRITDFFNQFHLFINRAIQILLYRLGDLFRFFPVVSSCNLQRLCQSGERRATFQRRFSFAAFSSCFAAFSTT